MTGKATQEKPVAITGGIASGKSRCARYLARRFGLLHIDADGVGRALIVPGGAGYERLRTVLAAEFFAADGTVNRRRLRDAIFADAGFRRRLEEILHPLIRAEIHRLAGTAGRGCLVEVPLLFEVGWQEDFQRVVVVYAALEQRLRRLQLRDGIDEAGVRAAIAAQAPLADKVLAADHVIDNSGPWPATMLELERLGRLLGWSALRKKRAKNLDSCDKSTLL